MSLSLPEENELTFPICMVPSAPDYKNSVGGLLPPQAKM